MKLTEQQIANYKKDGYIVVKGFFDKEKIAAIHKDVKEVFGYQIEKLLGVPAATSMAMNNEEFSQQVIALYNKDFQAFSNCSKQVQHLVSLHQLGVSEEVLDLLKQLGLAKPILSVRPCILMNNIKMDKDGEKGKYWRLPAHQDWYYSQGSIDSVTVWFPYFLCTKEIGSLEIIPGSHMWGLQECGDDSYGEMTAQIPDEKFITFDTEPGDVLVFISFLVHRSGVNSTNRIRWSSQLRFSNLVEPTFIERKFPNPFVYHPTRVLETPGFPKEEDLKKAFN